MTATTGAEITHAHWIGGRRVPGRLGTRALRVADRVDAGYVMINEYFAGGPAVPFGGTKHSGNGRERGLVALESYVKLKTVVARVGAAPEQGEPS